MKKTDDLGQEINRIHEAVTVGGSVLAIARDLSHAVLLDRDDPSIQTPVDLQAAMIVAGALYRIRELNERREGHVGGWREAGLPGEKYRLFVPLQ